MEKKKKTAQMLKLLHNYLFTFLVADYINKIITDSAIFSFITWYTRNLWFLISFTEKIPISVFCSPNHQKHLNSHFCSLKSVLLCYKLWNKKTNSNIWGPCQQSVPYPCIFCKITSWLGPHNLVCLVLSMKYSNI